MNLIIDLSKENPLLILKKRNRQVAVHQWEGLYQLSETLLIEIDKFLKENKIKLAEISHFKVIPSKGSLVSTRIAKAVALGLGIRRDEVL